MNSLFWLAIGFAITTGICELIELLAGKDPE